MRLVLELLAALLVIAGALGAILTLLYWGD
ncbi:hypothetical protein UFOVP143_26 [uncultured Caudovirales phage]|uniref:Uncharacterized protein n=1 Tax=uncultured Caudovirales phage TaxID=2100421 RepID=A0A6J7VNV0_9CAUD|nr:hypothetical protein UFOVP143_26 [uncultured Caudovirales phage]